MCEETSFFLILLFQKNKKSMFLCVKKSAPKKKNITKTFAVLLPSFLLRHQTLLIVKRGIRTETQNLSKWKKS